MSKPPLFVCFDKELGEWEVWLKLHSFCPEFSGNSNFFYFLVASAVLSKA